MSTEYQKYSIKNQQDAIRQYAARRGMEIVRTYADGGRSGVSMVGRDALKQLIEDVTADRADFDVIIVYDVSRWGRFQDIDESAFYEYACKQAGIEVQYCAEPFANDGSALSAIIKGVKRTMAAEYSRDLSGKCFAGARRLIQLGYKQGGLAGYGLRRMVIDESGAPKFVLAVRQQKHLATDRVILVPGPLEEIETVRWMYETFRNGKSEREIAAIMNAKDIKSDQGRAWNYESVRQVLTNEKYIGNSVWNRYSRKLHSKDKANPPSAWIRYDGAFTPIIDRQLFNAVQKCMKDRIDRLSSDEMLKSLKRLLDLRGTLTYKIIAADSSTPHASTYRLRFGSLRHAYRLVGFKMRPGQIRGRTVSRPIVPATTAGVGYCAMG